MRKTFSILGVIFTLAACSSEELPYEEAVFNSIANQYGEKGVFLDSLRKIYVNKANQELELGNIDQAERYGRLAENAVGGGVPTIHYPNELMISSEKLPALVDGYKTLKGALDSSAYVSQPEHLALALANYECWLQQEEKKSIVEVTSCKENYENHISYFDATDSVVESTKKVEEPKVIQTIKEETNTIIDGAVTVTKLTRMPKPTLVFFGLGSHTLSKTAMSKLDVIAQEYQNYDPDFIGLVGATDTSGSAEFNRKLAQKRVVAVAKYLVSKGVPQTLLKGKAAGESLLRNQTGDSKEDANNRFVAIGYKKNN